MKVLNLLNLFAFVSYVVLVLPTLAATIFRAEDKIYITKLKPKTKVDVSLQRITFRKLVADRCGEVSFESSSVPVLVLAEKEFNPTKFTLEATRVCTKDSPKSDRSYKTSNTRFVLAGLKPQQPYLLKIIKPSTKSLATNKCGYGSIAITQSLTAFASSYEYNIYAVNGKKLKDMSLQKTPQCKT